MDPKKAEGDLYFSTSLSWKIHNDVVSYDLSETIFELRSCIGFLKAQMESNSHFPKLSIVPITNTNVILEVNLKIPE